MKIIILTLIALFSIKSYPLDWVKPGDCFIGMEFIVIAKFDNTHYQVYSPSRYSRGLLTTKTKTLGKQRVPFAIKYVKSETLKGSDGFDTVADFYEECGK